MWRETIVSRDSTLKANKYGRLQSVSPGLPMFKGVQEWQAGTPLFIGVPAG